MKKYIEFIAKHYARLNTQRIEVCSEHNYTARQVFGAAAAERAGLGWRKSAQGCGAMALGCGGRLGARYRSDCAGSAVWHRHWAPISGLVHLVPMEEDETKRCGSSSVPRMHLLCLLLLVCCHPGNPELISSHRYNTLIFTPGHVGKSAGNRYPSSHPASLRFFLLSAEMGFLARITQGGKN